MGTKPPSLSFTTATSSKKGFNWILWGGIGACAIVIVVIGIVFAKRSGSGDGDYRTDV